MSSLADPVSPSRPARRTVTIPVPSLSGSAVLGAGVAIALAAAAFAAAGGLRLERTTDVLIAMMLGSAALVATALLRRPITADAPLRGGGPLLAFGLFAAFTALSVLWSLTPGDSWIEANRTFAYLAVFAAGIALARLLPGRWPAWSWASAPAACSSAPGRCSPRSSRPRWPPTRRTRDCGSRSRTGTRSA